MEIHESIENDPDKHITNYDDLFLEDEEEEEKEEIKVSKKVKEKVLKVPNPIVIGKNSIVVK